MHRPPFVKCAIWWKRWGEVTCDGSWTQQRQLILNKELESASRAGCRCQRGPAAFWYRLFSASSSWRPPPPLHLPHHLLHWSPRVRTCGHSEPSYARCLLTEGKSLPASVRRDIRLRMSCLTPAIHQVIVQNWWSLAALQSSGVKHTPDVLTTKRKCWHGERWNVVNKLEQWHLLASPTAPFPTKQNTAAIKNL